MNLKTNVFKHEKAVRSDGELNNGFYFEYDEHNRCVFNKDKNGFWVFKFYESSPHIITPYMVFHKYYHLYNPDVTL